LILLLINFLLFGRSPPAAPRNAWRNWVRGLPLIRADNRKVKQILVNLLSNAIKFTPDGGRVTIEAGIDEDQSVHIAVVDTGIGVAADDIAKAMTPFLQIDGAINRKFEGTGLGLPLTKALMELHRGKLTLSSAVGEGTRAVAVFPSARCRQRPAARRRA
jgi:two-component system cell cycle sensor histidine kinase PleC